MDTEPLYWTIVSDNNVGVQHMLGGRVETAIGLFKTALNASKALLRSPTTSTVLTAKASEATGNGVSKLRHQQQEQGQREEGGSQQAKHSSNEDRRTEPSSVTFHRETSSLECGVEQQAPASISSSATSILSTEEGYICAIPSRIPVETFKNAMDGGKGMKLKEQLSLVCLYNLALATHIQAYGFEQRDMFAHSPKIRQSMAYHRWGIAIRLYELTYTVLLNFQGGDTVNMMYYLTIVNNLGLIHKHRKETDKANNCFHRLLSALVFLKESSGDAGAGPNSAFSDASIPQDYQLSHQELSSECLTAFFSNAADEVILEKITTAPSA